MADRDIFITPFQGFLRSNAVKSVVICERLNLDRTTVYSWRKGAQYPNKDNADRLIELFREHGIELDYNKIYQPSVREDIA